MHSTCTRMLGDRHNFSTFWILCVFIIGCCTAVPCSTQNSSQVPSKICEVTNQGLFPELLPWAGEHTSGQCARDSKILREAASSGTLWAARMVDSCGRVNGALWGHRLHLGSFDGCLSTSAVSSLGSRYCLVDMVVPKQLQVSEPPRRWSHIDELPGDTDVRVALAGVGMAPGFWSPGHVRVAVCAPLSCGPAQLEAGLRTQLEAQERQLQVTINPTTCTDSVEMQTPAPIAAKLFWLGLSILTMLTIASPYFGWHHWDWRRHMQALGAPAPKDLAPLSGIRCIAIFMIIATHSGTVFIGSSLTTNQPMRETLFFDVGSAMMAQASVHVYTFFFMSGILSVAAATKRTKSHAIVLRLARLVPLLTLLVLFYAVALPFIGSGPVWKQYMCRESNACKHLWWTNLLFFNNYVHPTYGCLLQTWQIAVDFHLFLITLALQRVIQRHPLKLFTLLLIVAAVPPFLTAVVHRLPPVWFATPTILADVFGDPHFWSDYTSTHMRAVPYVMGMGCAMVIHICKTSRLRLSLFATWLVQAVAVLVLVAVVLACAAASDPSQPPALLVSALLFSLSPALWCIGLTALFVALMFGDNNIIRRILSWQPLVTLSRLSYGVFITGFVYQGASAAYQRQGLDGSQLVVIMRAASDLVFISVMSLWLHLILEAPVLSIATQILQRKTSRTEKTLNGRLDTFESSETRTSQKCKPS